jgi:hypothetical protein
MRGLAACLFLLMAASPATAHFADYGPADDVLTVRATMSKQYRLPPVDITRVLVVRDFAQAVGSSKGTLIIWYRKRATRWNEFRAMQGILVYDAATAARAESRGVPRDIARTMLRLNR